jgi:hypothetical protein
MFFILRIFFSSSIDYICKVYCFFTEIWHPNNTINKILIPMKSVTFLTGLFLLLSLSGIAGKVEQVYQFSNPVLRHNAEYQMLEFGNSLLTSVPGQPALPYRKVNLMLPPGESATGIEIVFSDEVTISGKFNLYPQQEVSPVSIGSSGAFLKDEAVYSKNSTFPADPKGQLITAFLNGRSFALSTFTPVRYNPVTGKLSYFATAKVVVRTAPDAKALKALDNLAIQNKGALKLADNKAMDQSYNNRQRSVTSNYDYLIITTPNFKNSFGSFKSNYLKEGITSLVATTDSINTLMTGMDLPEKMRNFILQEYQTHGIQYVLLAGDDELIPHRGFYCSVVSGSGYTDQNIPADLYYSALDGNWNTDGDSKWGEPGEDDLLPDIAVARMSFSNTAELNRMLNKSYKYQFTPVLGEFRNILMAGENLYSNPDTWGSDYLELLKGTRTDNGYTTTGIPTAYTFDYMYDETTNWSAQDLMNHLNLGRPMFNHVGHANETYTMKMYNSDITNTNFSGLNGTTHNYTIVYSHGCLCGAFDYNDCIAEKMVSIDNFAAAFVGNSRYGWFNEGQTEGPSAHLHREYMDALYSDSLNRIGRAHMESKIATASFVTAPGQWEPGALRWCFYDCNVLGDPALAVFTDNPIAINTTYPATVSVGTTSININITSGSSPAAGLTCVAMKDGMIIGKSVTDASGQAVINFDIMISDPCSAQLVVSGYNCVPVSYNFAFETVAGPYVIYANSILNDLSGNQNALPDFGETILLTAGMRNVGGTDASGVMVKLTTSDPYITISDSTELYNSIAAGDTVSIANAFTFKISDTVPNGHVVHFVLKATSGATWLSEFTITCLAPSLAAAGLMIDDISGGNGNGKLDPGETVTFKISSMNNGGSVCLNTTGTLTTTNPWVSITSPVCQLGAMAAGASVNAQFVATVSDSAPAGTIAELNYLLSSGGYHASASYYPTVWLIVEDFETGNFSQFPWNTSGFFLWTVTDISPLEGVYCGKSGQIGNGKQSTLALTLNVLGTDSISFYSKVSSEPIFDKLQFFIDIQPMGEWSGTLPWQRHSYPVTAGSHTFKWVYSKDNATNAGSDCAWVDFIAFPAFVDYTGTEESATGKLMLNISPNPAKEKLTVEAMLHKQSDYDLEVFNSDGKIVISTIKFTTDSDGRASRILDISALKPGYYACKIKSGGYTISKPFIVL